MAKTDLRVYPVKSIEDVLDTAMKFLAMGLGYAWFRGQPAARNDWQLLPKAFRGTKLLNEYRLATEFRLRAAGRATSLPPWEDAASWLCLMQHYGLPTRLLDWSTSPLIAAFWSVFDPRNEHAEEEGEIFCFHPAQFNRSLGYPADIFPLCMDHSTVATLCRGAFTAGTVNSGNQDICAAMPQHRDLRMMIQQSMFTVHNTAVALEDLPNATKQIIRLSVDKDAKKKISEQLRACGINIAYLFPDLSNLSMWLESFVEDQVVYGFHPIVLAGITEAIQRNKVQQSDSTKLTD